MLARLVADSLTKKLQPRIVANAEAEAAILTRGLKEALGTQGSARDHSKPGEAPRRQSGRLQEATKATANPDGSITVTTSKVGAILNPDRNFLRIALDATRDERLRARFKPVP